MNTITPLFEVAIEWETVTVGQVCQVNPGKPKSDALPADAPVSFVPMAAVDEVAGAITQSEDRAFSKVRSSYTAFRDGDVIFAKITPCMENGKAAIAGGLTNGLGFGSSEFHVLRPSEKVLPEFVYQLLRQKSFRAEAKDNMTGSVGQARVPTEWLKSFEFTLPSIEEQREIVRLVAQLQAQMESTSDRLSTIPTLLKKFRQSILATACSGQLTADWRNERGIDSAPDLKGLTKAKGKKALEQPVELELPDLPDSYAAVSVGEIVQLIQYGTSSKSGIQSPGSVPVLRMGNIQNGTLDLKELKYAKPDKEILGLLLEPGDILFNRTNSPDLVGKTAVFREPSQMTFASYLIRLRVAPGLAVPEFVSYWFNSSWGKEWAHLAKTDGVSQSNINGTKLSVMPIPLPHFAEQEEIVRRVESLFALADSIESRLAEASAQVERTTQAILAKAFRGELACAQSFEGVSR